MLRPSGAVYTVAAPDWQRPVPMWQNCHKGAPTDAIASNFRDTVRMDSGISDEVYQGQILPHVSRTFALTIPQLPAALRISVTLAAWGISLELAAMGNSGSWLRVCEL